MVTTVIDLHDFGGRTPEQVLRAFSSRYSANAVKRELFKLFAEAYGNRVPGDRELEVAELIDKLVELVAAVEQLPTPLEAACSVKKT